MCYYIHGIGPKCIGALLFWHPEMMLFVHFLSISSFLQPRILQDHTIVKQKTSSQVWIAYTIILNQAGWAESSLSSFSLLRATLDL